MKSTKRTPMSKATKYSLLAIAGFVLWFVETAAFGWNREAGSTLEEMLDFVSLGMMFWGVVGNILSGVSITKNETHNITPDKFEYHDHRTVKVTKPKGGKK